MKSRLARLTLRVVVTAAVLLSLAGCQADEISSYSVPRSGDDIGSGNTRLLVAVVPAGESTWFFKLVGRHDIIEMVEPAFVQLVNSFQASDKLREEVGWKVPPNWKEDRENKNRVATLRPEGIGRPEIAISRLDGKAALKPNVDRWRRIDLGLGPISGRALPRVVTTKKVGPLEVTLVDMRGPGVERPDASRMAPPAGMGAGPKTRPPSREKPIKYQVPAGWKEVEGSAIAAAAFSMGEGEQTARLLVTPLNGAMPGGLLANVNRWRQEVGLGALGDIDLPKLQARPITVAGVEARYLDLTGPGARSLVVWLETDGRTWFFKLRGPNNVVEANKDKFESFLKSVTLR
ncbi:MAG: hypothetical protein U0840_22730 [Gemmataceae bacterium]